MRYCYCTYGQRAFALKNFYVLILASLLLVFPFPYHFFLFVKYAGA